MSNAQRAPHLFQPGHDPRRTSSSPGRIPSAEKIEQTVRSVLARGDLKGRLEQLDVLAQAGDPAAVVASATLLAAVLRQPG